MGTPRAYWLCQLGGWGGYVAMNCFFMLQLEERQWTWIAISTAAAITGLLYTHVLREAIRRQGWLQMPLRALAPRVVAATLAGGALMAAVHGTLEMSLGDSPTEIPWSAWPALTLWWGTLVFGWQILYFGIHLVQERERAHAERWQLQAAVKEAELKALKSQLDPHFMFNCLNSIRALILDDPQAAQGMVTRLAGLLRYSLRTQGSTVPLEEELATVRTYLDLESIRLEERLRYEIDVDDDVHDVPVPPMVVQTLVENAIRHGVATLPGGGMVRVRSFLDNGNLHVHVINDGRLGSGTPSTGVGLKNAMERIRLLYGGRGSLNLTASASETVTADLEIPVRP